MNINYVLLLCILSLNIVWSFDKTLFLQDFFKLNHGTNVVEAHLCWKQDKFIRLSNILAKINKRYSLLTSEKLCPEQHKYNRIFIADLDCPFFHSLMKEVLLKGLYKFPNKWIIFGSVKKLEELNYYFPINSFVMVISKTINSTFKIQTLYKRNSTILEYSRSIIGKWSKNEGFLFYNDLVLVRNRSDFMGMPLRVSYIFLDKNSLHHLTDGRDRHLDKLTKLNYLLYRHFVDIWNMTQIILITDDWGLERHPTKQYYKGMLGDLHYGRADISGSLSFTPTERLEYFKYLVATIKELGVLFVFRAPPLPYSTNIFAMPFDKYVWISCGIVVILCCFVIRIILKWEETEKTFVESREETDENAPNFLDIAMMQIAVVCQMDYFYEPRSSSGRIATFTLLLGFSYIYTAYSARIVLLLQSYANNLNDVKQIYDAKMDMAAEDIPYNRYYFSRPANRTNEYLRKLIYENKISPKGSSEAKFYQAEKGIKLVQTSYFAFHMETTTASNLIESLFTNEQKCSVRTIETIFKADIAHLSCPKNSTFTEYFLIGFHKLFETGVHEREHRKTFTKTPKCVGKGSIFVSVGLVECYFAFEIFTIGVCLSFFIFLMEHISALRVLSKSSNISQSSSHESKPKKKNLMSEEQQLATEIRALKDQIDNLKAAIAALQDDTEKKEVALANIAREKEKLTLELLKQKRSNNNLLHQLEDERKFYFKEKEIYCQEMNEFKKLKRAMSNTSTNKSTNKDELSAEQYKKEIAKIKQTLSQTLEANYNLSIKFLRMKNTKTCLKTELKTMQLEHEKLVNNYKAKIESLSEELNEIISEKLDSPISCSSKKYLQLVKQNSCLVYENLCLQLKLDNMHIKFEKLKLGKIKSETNSKLKYIKHESSKAKSPTKTMQKEHKRVRIKDDRPEKLEKNVSIPSTSKVCNSKQNITRQPSREEILKIFERNKLPGIPDIKILSDFESPGPSRTHIQIQIPTVQENVQNQDTLKKSILMKNVLDKPNSKLALFQVSNVSSRTSVATSGGLIRVHSSPDIVQNGSV